MSDGLLCKSDGVEGADLEIEEACIGFGEVKDEVLWGRYRYVRDLLGGAQARTRLYQCIENGELVVIKSLNIGQMGDWKSYELFEREANTLRALEIKGVPKFIEYVKDESKGCVYLVQEYIDAEPISDLCKSGKLWLLSEVLDVARSMAEILKALHSRNPQVIHRDIKSSNILYKGGVCYLIDFGSVGNRKRDGMTVTGTIGYMPPEQIMGEAVAASDIYSLGVCLVEMVSGVAAYEMEADVYGLNYRHYVEHLPKGFVKLLEDMLEVDVKKRLSDSNKLLYRISRLQMELRGGQGVSVLDDDENIVSSHQVVMDKVLSSYPEAMDLKGLKVLQQPGSQSLFEDLKSGPSLVGAYRRVFLVNMLIYFLIIVVGISVPALIMKESFLMSLSGWAWGLGLIFAVSSFGFFPLLKYREILADGQKAVAEVIGIQNSEWSGIVEVKYRFEVRGEKCEGSMKISHKQTALLRIGDYIGVLYKNGGEDSMIFPLPVRYGNMLY